MTTHLFIVHDKDDLSRYNGDECFWLLIENKEACERLLTALRKEPHGHLGRAALALLCDTYSYKLNEQDYAHLSQICNLDVRTSEIGSLHRVCRSRLHKIGPVRLESLILPSLLV